MVRTFVPQACLLCGNQFIPAGSKQKCCGKACPSGKKICWKCQTARPRQEFSRHKAKPDGLSGECKSCHRVRLLRRQYGVSAEWYAVQIENGCQACGATEPGGRGREFHVDHDHSCRPGNRSCGECVRGVLCAACNVGIGYFDGPLALRNAADYLERVTK